MLFTAALVLAGVVSRTFAEPEPPALTYLYSVNLTIPPPIDIGSTPLGSRGVLSITGGTFSGPKLNGTVKVGLDWGLTDSAGTFNPDAIYVIETHDGATIMVTEKGHAPNVHILFETASEDYAWLNSVAGFATGGPVDGGVALDVWQVGGSGDGDGEEDVGEEVCDGEEN